MTTALVLAGHGSHISAETAGLVWAHVDALRALGVADEVTAAFWKEQPSFHHVLGTLEADDVTVVPVFTAQGYFTQTVIPTEMGLDGPATWRSGKLIRYARTLSEHPYLADVVRRRVDEAAHKLGTTPDKLAVAIVGHSTRRNRESRMATEAQAERIRASGIAGQVQAVYLDDKPGIAEIYTLTSAPNLIAVPFFLALGSHTTIDVPAELGIDAVGEIQAINGRRVYYTPPVGIEDDLRAAILQLARDAGAPLSQASGGSAWDAFPSAGRDKLLKTVADAGTMRFGDLCLTSSEVRPWDDPEAADVLDHPNTLREHIREQPFRSLATAIGLPSGWRVKIDRPEQLQAVVETVYPGVVADWALARRSSFQPNSFERTIARQTGNYRRLAGWSTERQARIVGKVCSGCVLGHDWYDNARTPPASMSTENDKLPCPEPCNHWLSAALDSLDEPTSQQN